jgi:hypothetical protein
MDRSDSLKVRRACPERSRRDGWTPERQLRFLDALAFSRSVTKAAAAAGMSREGAYRLRSRLGEGLFARLWDRALQPDSAANSEVHIHAMTNGRLMRLLGTHFRRERGDFRRIGAIRSGSRD